MKDLILSQKTSFEADLSTRNFIEFLLYVSVYLPDIILGKWQFEQLESTRKELKKRFKDFMMEENLSDFDPQPEWDEDQKPPQQPKKSDVKKRQSTGTKVIQLSLFVKKIPQKLWRLFKRSLLSIILTIEHLIKLSTFIFKSRKAHQIPEENRFKQA